MNRSARETRVEDSSETEGARSATGVSETEPSVAGRVGEDVPNPEVPAKAERRKFTAEYKLRVVREAERCKEPGQIGALLRREGLYSSLLSAWRREVEQGARAALRSKKRGPKARLVDPRVKELERENARLRKRLEQAELIIAVQKKASELLGIPLKSPDDDESN
jgi:transposase-like protein